jgi:hypothetical protein
VRREPLTFVGRELRAYARDDTPQALGLGDVRGWQVRHRALVLYDPSFGAGSAPARSAYAAGTRRGDKMGDFPAFEELDTDDDGKVSYEEMRRFHTNQPMPYILPEWLADTDRDQTITKEEYEAFKSRYERPE